MRDGQQGQREHAGPRSAYPPVDADQHDRPHHRLLLPVRCPAPGLKPGTRTVAVVRAVVAVVTAVMVAPGVVAWRVLAAHPAVLVPACVAAVTFAWRVTRLLPPR